MHRGTVYFVEYRLGIYYKVLKYGYSMIRYEGPITGNQNSTRFGRLFVARW